MINSKWSNLTNCKIYWVKWIFFYDLIIIRDFIIVLLDNLDYSFTNRNRNWCQFA